MQRSASAHWQGGLKDGRGTVTTDSGVLSQTQYSFSTRFENGIGTNPEELIAAAHAGCFSMALTFEKTDAGFTITKIHLELRAKVPGADDAKFQKAAADAKAGCPVSRVLKAEITLDAKLV